MQKLHDMLSGIVCLLAVVVLIVTYKPDKDDK